MGSGAQAGLVREDAARDALLHGDDDGAQHAARSRLQAERAFEDGDERAGDLVEVRDDEQHRETHVQNHHRRDHALGHLRDALQAADDHKAHQHGQHDGADDGEDGVVHAKDAHRGVLLGVEEPGDGAGDRVDLRERSMPNRPTHMPKNANSFASQRHFMPMPRSM